MEELERLPGANRDAPSKSLRCCCGLDDCRLLKNNCSVLDRVEKDVHTAAQLGQALLSRHEAYMAQAERDRHRLTARIERLELEKQELEAGNTTKTEENENLLSQLETLNGTVTDADNKIRSLEASLLSSQQTIRRLEGVVIRANDAEDHLRLLEEEQDRLSSQLRVSKEDARSHAQHFKDAQRGIIELQEQIEVMEKEARIERERHAEIVERMERQRDVEKQLEAAALRLKEAAVTKSMNETKSSDGVKYGNNRIVGNFVRDLLQDNANLQLAIAELREMLLNSNDEVQSLREQLLYYQPLPEDHGSSPASTLKAELDLLSESPRMSQELHVHHHYHFQARQEVRKSRKKRQSLLPGIFTPPATTTDATTSCPPTPAVSDVWPSTQSSSASTHDAAQDLTCSSYERPSRSSANWSEFQVPNSDVSSVLDSPQSIPRGLFDDEAPETEGLMSPTTSYDPMSPTWRGFHRKRASEASSCSFQSLSVIEGESSTQGNHSSHRRWTSTTIYEENEDLLEVPETRRNSTSESTAASEADQVRRESVAPVLRRIASHESIMSLSGGLDIHTLMSRPSQMTLRPLGGADAVVTGVVAEPILSRGTSKRSDAALRDHFAGFQGKLSSSLSSQDSINRVSRNAGGGIGKWVGWRPWGGAASTPAVTDIEDATNDPPSTSAPKPVTEEEAGGFKRAPGINQPGTVPGFQKYWIAQKRKGAPAQVTVETLDRDALSESLRE